MWRSGVGHCNAGRGFGVGPEPGSGGDAHEVGGHGDGPDIVGHDVDGPGQHRRRWACGI